MPIVSLIHVTAAYSNAVLVAVLPHVSDFGKKLDLPIPQPITASQVAHCNVAQMPGDIGAGVWLTNHYSFGFGHGYVSTFRCKNNPFYSTGDEDPVEWLSPFVGKDNMTTNEAVELARDSFRKLGYKQEDFNVNKPPTRLDGPGDSKKLGHIPYCQVEWTGPESTAPRLQGSDYYVRFDIDMQRKQVVGMNLSGKKFWQSSPKVDIVPELEADYQKRIQGHMFVRTNAPAHITQPRLMSGGDSRFDASDSKTNPPAKPFDSSE